MFGKYIEMHIYLKESPDFLFAFLTDLKFPRRTLGRWMNSSEGGIIDRQKKDFPGEENEN